MPDLRRPKARPYPEHDQVFAAVFVARESLMDAMNILDENAYKLADFSPLLSHHTARVADLATINAALLVLSQAFPDLE